LKQKENLVVGNDIGELTSRYAASAAASSCQQSASVPSIFLAVLPLPFGGNARKHMAVSAEPVSSRICAAAMSRFSSGED
jgi:hypothetical protein